MNAIYMKNKVTRKVTTTVLGEAVTAFPVYDVLSGATLKPHVSFGEHDRRADKPYICFHLDAGNDLPYRATAFGTNRDALLSMVESKMVDGKPVYTVHTDDRGNSFYILKPEFVGLRLNVIGKAQQGRGITIEGLEAIQQDKTDVVLALPGEPAQNRPETRGRRVSRASQI